jgi:hypothetical protein
LEAVQAMIDFMDRPDRPFIGAEDLKSMIDEGRK